jgi:Glycosyltransferase family 87
MSEAGNEGFIDGIVTTDNASSSRIRYRSLRWLRSRRWDRWIIALYGATVLAIVIHQGATRVDNNFMIYRASYQHLVAGQSLYADYPAEHTDKFKYSPTFALLFAPFAQMPVLIALLLWDSLNVFLLFYAVRKLLPGRDGMVALALVYLEVVRTTQRAQANALVAALMILAYIAIEQRRQLTAALAIALGGFVKIFPIAVLSVAIFHPRRLRMALIFTAVVIVGAALPLLVTSPAALATQYAAWYTLEAHDAFAGGQGGGGAGVYGGVMYLFQLSLGVKWANWPIQLFGVMIQLTPLLRRHCWNDPDFRLRYLCSLLVFVVLFNHQAESPSFVIAVTGIAVWFASSARMPLDVALMALTLLIVSVSSTELVPHWLQRDLFAQYRLKTIPCALVWLVMLAELLGLRRRSNEPNPSTRQKIPSALDVQME